LTYGIGAVLGIQLHAEKRMHVKKRSNNKKRNLVRVVAHEMGIESSLKNGGKKIRSSKPPTGSLCRSKSRNAKVNSVFSQVVLVWFKWNRLHDVTKDIRSPKSQNPRISTKRK
jgi:hypothetical protein